MQPFKTDIAVLILFFNRPECLAQVFEAVREARPSRLFLYQDGPRNETDMAGIEACRKIVENIDWQCDVRRNYQEKNYGCDPSNYLAQRWAFSLTDKCMFFEDDSIPSESFFPFCKEMLDRYENDERVMMIAGFNTDEITTDAEADYFFTSVMSIWGWASWRRVFLKWDTTYSFLDDENTMQHVRRLMRERHYCRETLRACYDHRASGREYYETLLWSAMLLNNGLTVMPSRNMVTNLGPTAGSTHYKESIVVMPRRLRRLHTMRRFDLNFPLRHPVGVMEHVAYRERNNRVYAYGHPLIKICRSIEELWLNLRHGNFSTIGRAVRRRVAIWTGRRRHK